ncbi:hypothetical protein L2K20_06130 [Mycobacterium sp. MBM]|nr:hypothetical protein [Mycobacterium sp. MBM]
MAVVGLLDSRGLADPVTSWAAFGAIATVATAVVAIWTLIALKQDSADRTRPVIVAELRHAVLSRYSEFLVRNVGQSVARNVRVEFDPPLPGPDSAVPGVLTPFLQRRYSRVIPTFAPGMVMDNYYQDAEDPSEPLPEDFAVRISYSDGHGREFVDTYELTLGTLNDQTAGYPSNDDERGMQRRVAKALEAIARGVGRH